MKHRKQILSLLLALLLLLACIPAAAFAADGAESGFRYQHDPRLNARAMEDIVADPAAVYGFRPSPEGSLAAYADADWTDPALVNGENGRGARIAYHESVQALYALLGEMTENGMMAFDKTTGELITQWYGQGCFMADRFAYFH